MGGLVTRYQSGEFEAETVKAPAPWRDETIKVAAVPKVWLLDTVRLAVPKVRLKPDEITFGTPAHNESINLWLVVMFSIMFFVFFLVLLWMFS